MNADTQCAMHSASAFGLAELAHNARGLREGARAARMVADLADAIIGIRSASLSAIDAQCHADAEYARRAALSAHEFRGLWEGREASALVIGYADRIIALRTEQAAQGGAL